MPTNPTLKALHDIVHHAGPIPDELFTQHSRPLMEVLQERMDDPNYVPTGPTYGEVMKPPTEDETQMAIAKVNFLRGAEQERERCAEIASNHKCDDSGDCACAEAIEREIRMGA